MADEDKTEEPTAKKLTESFSSGQFAKATEINTALVLLTAVLLVWMLAPAKTRDMMEFTTSVMGRLHETRITEEGFLRVLLYFGKFMVMFVLPLAVLSFFVSFLAEGLQTRFRLTPKAFGFKANRLNPIKGLQRIFGKDALVAFGVDLMKFTAVGVVIFITLLEIMKHPIFTSMVPPEAIGMFILQLFLLVLFRLFLMITVIAVINYMYQRYSNHEKMKMTKQEVKEEQKSQEVDPHVKNAQRALMGRLLRKQQLDEVPTADVVVTNPTHFAVALKYERGKDAAPVVLAKGAGAFAIRIKGIAAEHDVPMVENVPVARMLYKVAQVGQVIPVELYQVVAQILAHVYRAHAYYFHRLKSRRIAARAANTK